MNHEQTISQVLGTVKQLQEGEKVVVEAGYKERTLTVSSEAEFLDREPYRCNATAIRLEGYGTEYRLECPDTGYDRLPALHYPSTDINGEIVKNVEPQDRVMGIVAEKTAADLGIPPR